MSRFWFNFHQSMHCILCNQNVGDQVLFNAYNTFQHVTCCNTCASASSILESGVLCYHWCPLNRYLQPANCAQLSPIQWSMASSGGNRICYKIGRRWNLYHESHHEHPREMRPPCTHRIGQLLISIHCRHCTQFPHKWYSHIAFTGVVWRLSRWNFIWCNLMHWGEIDHHV